MIIHLCIGQLELASYMLTDLDGTLRCKKKKPKHRKTTNNEKINLIAARSWRAKLRAFQPAISSRVGEYLIRRQCQNG